MLFFVEKIGFEGFLLAPPQLYSCTNGDPPKGPYETLILVGSHLEDSLGFIQSNLEIYTCCAIFGYVLVAIQNMLLKCFFYFIHCDTLAGDPQLVT